MHACRWRTAAEKLEAELAEQKSTHASELAAVIERLNAVEHKLALSTRQIVGPKSERMPTPEEEAKKREGKTGPRGGYANPKKRKENAEALASLPTTIVPHRVPEEERHCSHCGEEIKPIGKGDRSVEYEWVPDHIERRVHVVEVGRCPCKMHYARGRNLSTSLRQPTSEFTVQRLVSRSPRWVC